MRQGAKKLAKDIITINIKIVKNYLSSDGILKELSLQFRYSSFIAFLFEIRSKIAIAPTIAVKIVATVPKNLKNPFIKLPPYINGANR